jgi:hypothetical protein
LGSRFEVLAGSADAGLTLGGFLALLTMILAVIGLVASLFNRTTIQRERVTRLEVEVQNHLTNGRRHLGPRQDDREG